MRAWSFEGATLGGDDAWFSICASRRMLDVANAYLRLWAKLSYVDLWYTAQQPASDERVASQNWHVDFDDKHLLKAFVYLSDVERRARPVRVRPRQPAGRPPPRSCGRGCRWATAASRTTSLAEQVPAEEIATLHRPEGHADPLQHERPPPRRLRDGRAARARDRDLLLACVAQGALEPELRVAARGRRPTRSSATPSRRRGRRRAPSSTRASAARRRAAAR